MLKLSLLLNKEKRVCRIVAFVAFDSPFCFVQWLVEDLPPPFLCCFQIPVRFSLSKMLALIASSFRFDLARS